MGSGSGVSREILRLAIPSLGAMVAQPLFLLTDAAMVGTLGTTAVASLALAGTVVQTVVGVLIFLTYATTPLVSRRRGAGDEAGALAAGINGVWIALVVGVVLAIGVGAASTRLVSLFGADATVTAAAAEFLAISAVGIPAMLVTLAATGFLRGFGDARTPLAVAVVGFVANAGLNALLIFAAGWGLAGSAWGSVIATYLMAAALLYPVIRRAHRAHSRLLPGRDSLIAVGHSASWLLLRTLSLRVSMVAYVAVATSLGTEALAASHIVSTIVGLLALILDALEVPAQALVGESLGASDVPRTHAMARTITRMAVATGFVVGVGLAASASVIPVLFTRDAAVATMITGALWVVAAALPLAGYVFAWDGILIGAGDSRYLAGAGVVNLLVALPGFVVVFVNGNGLWGIIALQIVWSVLYMGARALTLGRRARGDAWMRIGHDRMAATSA